MLEMVTWQARATGNTANQALRDKKQPRPRISIPRQGPGSGVRDHWTGLDWTGLDWTGLD